MYISKYTESSHTVLRRVGRSGSPHRAEPFRNTMQQSCLTVARPTVDSDHLPRHLCNWGQSHFIFQQVPMMTSVRWGGSRHS